MYQRAWVRVPTLVASWSSLDLTDVNNYYESVLANFQKRADITAKEALELYNGGALDDAYDIALDYMVECNSGGYISIRRLEQLYTGGLHYTTTTSCETFSAADGHLYTLDELFSVPREEYLPVLLKQVEAKILKSPEDYNSGWEESMEVCFPYDTFCVTEGGLSLFYQELTLAAYAIGEVRVDIPWSVLEDIWKQA